MREDPFFLVCVPDSFVTQGQVKLWHDDDYYCNDNELSKLYEGYQKCRTQKAKIKKIHAYCLASIKMAGLVHVRRREKTERRVVEVTDSCFKII